MAEATTEGAVSGSGEYTLVLHTLPAGILVPNVSPFVLKLETYMRMAGINYTIDTKKPFGVKGKTPWITFNGQDVDDSELIIAFLNKTLNKNLWGDTTKEEKAIAHSMRILLENHLLLGLAAWRFGDGINTIDKILPISGIKLWAMKMTLGRRVKNALYSQGFGRFSPEEQMTMIKKDFSAISDYLGGKNYFMGNEFTEIDATVFGVVAQFLYGSPGSPYEKLIEDDYSNLKSYCERMKAEFWKDWDSVLHK